MRLRENAESPTPQKRRRKVEPTESAEQAARVAEATVAERWASGQQSSAFVGVSWSKKDRKWVASIKHDERLQKLGLFEEETKSSVTRWLRTRSANGRRAKARPAVAARIGARNSTGEAVLREIMRLDRNFWARRVWVDFRKPSCYHLFGAPLEVCANC